MTWSPAAFAVWGKLDPAAASWMPLVTHLEHSAAVAGLLYDHYLPGAVRKRLGATMGLPDDQVRAACCWLAGIHDVAKASPAFACKAEAILPGVLDRMRDEGLIAARPLESLGHGTIGQYVLREWLVATKGAPGRAATTWAVIIGGHHGKNPSDKDLEDVAVRPDAVGRGRWVDVRQEILEGMARRTGADPHLPTWATRRLPATAQALLTAIVVMADWISSNQDYFPYRDDLTPEQRARVAWDRLDLPMPWAPAVPRGDADALLHRRFPALAADAARPVQTALLSCALDSREAPLLIVEAPMGVGKTEAALMAAEALASRFGQGGIYIGLPTMATANSMFDRTLDWLTTALGRDDASVTLAHGKAGLNDRFAGLTPESWQGMVYDEVDDPRAGIPVVNGWLRGRKKAGLASFVVGTIDQGLFGALKAKHVVLRHLSLVGKVVVIDECHAADTYMREYLKRLLSWLGAYHAPVVLMSATLPPTQRDEYLAAYAWGRGDRGPGTTDRSDTYPRVTRYDGALRDIAVGKPQTATQVRLERVADAPDGVRHLLRSLLADGGIAGVICNTVQRAQDVYRFLRDEFGANAVLLHSRFIAPDRAEREARLVAQLGRDGSRRPHRLVVVGTQVLEQSLDIDFDVMVTDLAPADLVLQRLGRLHRHARPRRPDAVATPVVYLRGVDDWTSIPPRAVKGSRTVYGESALLRSAAVLDGRTSLSLPMDIPRLVRQAYDPALTSPPGWEENWAFAEIAATAEVARASSRAQSFLLDDPLTRENLNGWIDVDPGDPDRSEEQGRSQVRDSEDSLEVIALWRDLSGTLHLPTAGATRHAGATIPVGVEWGIGAEQSLAKAMASCTVPLPARMTNGRAIASVISALERTVDASGWQQSPWLAGQLVIVFGPDDRARVADFDLTYSPTEGLIVTGLEEHQ